MLRIYNETLWYRELLETRPAMQYSNGKSQFVLGHQLRMPLRNFSVRTLGGAAI